MRAPPLTLPPFLEDVVKPQAYVRWLKNRAIAHCDRDCKRGNTTATRAAYRAAIHSAVLKSGERCPYSGVVLDWHLISTYDNAKSKSGRRAYKATLARLPTVDHVGDGLGDADFVICSWAVNDAKGDLSLSQFLELCKKVLKYNGKKRQRQRVRPPKTSDVFRILAEDVAELHYLRNAYDFLFTSEHFAKLFDRTAPIFFSDLYMMIFEGLTLSASRLLDRAESFGRDNCSLELLLSLIEATGQSELLCERLQQDLDSLRARNPLKFFRDRRSAHRDLEFALEKLHEQSGVKMADLDALLDGIDGMMNAVAEICGCNAQTFFRLIKAAGAQEIVLALQPNAGDLSAIPLPG